MVKHPFKIGAAMRYRLLAHTN